MLDITMSHSLRAWRPTPGRHRTYMSLKLAWSSQQVLIQRQLHCLQKKKVIIISNEIDLDCEGHTESLHHVSIAERLSALSPLHFFFQCIIERFAVSIS